MAMRCPLCRQRVPNHRRSWCTCGQAMDSRCRDDHEPWCPKEGAERWIGAAEL